MTIVVYSKEHLIRGSESSIWGLSGFEMMEDDSHRYVFSAYDLPFDLLLITLNDFKRLNPLIYLNYQIYRKDVDFAEQQALQHCDNCVGIG